MVTRLRLLAGLCVLGAGCMTPVGVSSFTEAFRFASSTSVVPTSGSVLCPMALVAESIEFPGDLCDAHPLTEVDPAGSLATPSVATRTASCTTTLYPGCTAAAATCPVAEGNRLHGTSFVGNAAVFQQKGLTACADAIAPLRSMARTRIAALALTNRAPV